MDYLTRPISRQELRSIAMFIRKLFGCKNKYKFDVVKAFEMMHYKIKEVKTDIVYDDELEDNVPARCIPCFDGSYIIQVKQSVYDGAYNGVGGYRAHILHEMCHVLLCILGFEPILQRSFKNNQIPAFRTMEWQAKALCGEIMMPYEATTGLSVKQIMKKCGVSESSARLRFNDYKGGDRK